MIPPRLVLIESNTSGTGRLFARLANRLGVRPILLTDNPSRYPYAEEDHLEILQTDTADENAVLRACARLESEQGIAGIFSSSEYFILMAARMASKLGLPGTDPEVIGTCRDKHAQRICLQRAGLGIPAFHSARSVSQAVSAAADLGFPVVVKPVSGTGSTGVKLCSTGEEVEKHAGALLRQRRNERGLRIPSRILVEELVEGPEYSVEVFGAQVIGITRKHLGPHPHFVEVGHDYPATLSTVAQRIIVRDVTRAAKALGLTWGPTHFELRVTNTGPRIIEVNPRLAGGYIPEVVRQATGIDLISETIKVAVDQRAHLRKSYQRHASIRFIMPPGDGLLAEVDGLDRARRRAGVRDVQMYVKLGDTVQLRGDFRDRIGHVLAVGATSEASRARVETAHGLIRPIVNLAAGQVGGGIQWTTRDASSGD